MGEGDQDNAGLSREKRGGERGAREAGRGGVNVLRDPRRKRADEPPKRQRNTGGHTDRTLITDRGVCVR